MSERVNVLLSTYNGARFLPEQLASLAAQDGVEVVVTARDDGSTDGTVALLEAFAAGFGAMRVAAEDNVGAANSFLTLLERAEADCGYFAFCDQDDVWRSDKLRRAVDALEGVSGPALYCARQEYVDEALAHVGYSKLPAAVDLRAALVENVACGCTVVLNRAARDVLLAHRPARVIMHDWWCYMVVAAVGRVVYDAEPTIRYRQHGRNTFGPSRSRFQQFRRRLHWLMTENAACRLSDQARELWRGHSSLMTAENEALVAAFVASTTGAGKRLRYALTTPLLAHSPVDKALLRMLIVAGLH